MRYHTYPAPPRPATRLRQATERHRKGDRVQLGLDGLPMTVEEVLPDGSCWVHWRDQHDVLRRGRIEGWRLRLLRRAAA